MWTVVDFGKWTGKGKTLPQIITSDPDWFFWCVENDKFVGSLASQAKTLARRAHAIRLPAAKSATHCVAYVITHDGKFAGFDLVPTSRPQHEGSSSEVRRSSLDLAAPRSFKGRMRNAVTTAPLQPVED